MVWVSRKYQLALFLGKAIFHLLCVMLQTQHFSYRQHILHMLLICIILPNLMLSSNHHFGDHLDSCCVLFTIDWLATVYHQPLLGFKQLNPNFRAIKSIVAYIFALFDHFLWFSLNYILTTTHFFLYTQHLEHACQWNGLRHRQRIIHKRQYTLWVWAVHKLFRHIVTFPSTGDKFTGCPLFGGIEKSIWLTDTKSRPPRCD